MKICPACQESNHNAADYCLLCGASLHSENTPPEAEILSPPPPTPPNPPEGTHALAIYHDEIPHIIHFARLDTEILLIGREDPRKSIFPDLDLDSLTHLGVGSQHVSRRHARVLRTPNGFALEALPASTGTQHNKTLLNPGQRRTLTPGDRIILGCRVRMKYLVF